jgi:hypothetical protein
MEVWVDAHHLNSYNLLGFGLGLSVQTYVKLL